MAHITAEHARPSIFAGLRSMVDSWQKELERHRVFRQTYRELEMLSDRELSDIGVGRADIVSLAWDAAHRA